MQKTKDKKKAKKGLFITLVVIVAIVAVIVIALNLLTLPVADSSEKAVAVGGMIMSDTVTYQNEDAKKLESNPIVKIMQVVWKGISKSDAKVHATQTPPENIEKIKDIPYLDDANIYHLLDVYYPKGTTQKLPVIIDIHGGGWMYGDKNLNENYCLSLADRGYVVFNMSYRLVPDVTVNEQIQDVMHALKWISENMSQYPCDMQNIMLTGDSAGGQLAAYAAVLLQSEELRGTFDVVDADMQLTALLLTSPVSYMNGGDMFSVYTKILWGKNYKEKPTADYMNLDQIIDYAQLVPTYLITSSGDSLAHSQTLKAAELLKEKGVECQLADYGKVDGKKLAHVFSVLEPFDNAGTTAIDEALAFYQKAINNTLETDSNSEKDTALNMNNMVEYLNNTITNEMSLSDIVDTFEQASRPMNTEDMILFETGTYNFTGEKLFYFSLVKQIPNEDDEYRQVHLDILYKPDSKNKKFHSTVWSDELDESIFDYIKNSKAFDYAKNTEYTDVNIYMDET